MNYQCLTLNLNLGSVSFIGGVDQITHRNHYPSVIYRYPLSDKIVTSTH